MLWPITITIKTIETDMKGKQGVGVMGDWGEGGGGGDDTPLAANDFFEGNIGKTFERRSVARNYGFSRAHKYHLELN